MKAVVHALARRVGLARWRGPELVPPLRTGPARAGASPVVWVVTPDWDRPSGGIRKEYGVVDALTASGVRAAVVHGRPGFSCTWFQHSTPVVAAGDVVVAPHDVIVVPEVYGASALDLPGGVRQVVLNQNAFVTLDALARDATSAAAPYLRNPALAGVATVSEHNADLLRYLFPGAPVSRVRVGVDPRVHHPSAGSAGTGRPRVAYMPRRRSAEAAQVLAVLAQRGALDGWEVVAVDGLSETEAAARLRSCRVFLSFSEREGLGLPPLEALASGCAVVGFDGFAGREYFHEPFAVPVQDGDVPAFAAAAEQVLQRAVDRPAEHASVVAAGVSFVRENYSPDQERDDVVSLFAPLVAA